MALSSRRVSTLNQRPPQDINQKVVRFILYVRGMLEKHQGSKFWACDETPVFYDLVTKSTFEKKGNVEVKIKTTGSSKKWLQ